MVAAGSACLATLGRVLAMPELFVLAAGGGALVVAAQVWVRLPRPTLEAVRELHPPKLYAGGSSRVELRVTNAGRRRAPVLALRDPFAQGRRQARFLLAPLRPGASARAAYRLPTERRGVFPVGPLEVDLVDPFGVSSRTRTVAGTSRLTVYPPIDTIVPLAETRGQDPHAGADHPTAFGASGDDFYTLRPYQMGDDLRRVHWRSTARLGDLMIRQLEAPWQGRVTVLLDARRRSHRGESLELAVSAAASILTACWNRGWLVRLVATGGIDTRFGGGPQHMETVMEKLAALGPSDDGALEPVMARLQGPHNAGALAAVLTAESGPGDLDGVTRLHHRFGSVTLVVFEPSSYAGDGAGSRLAGSSDGGPARTGTNGRGRSGAAVVRVTASRPFATAWNQALTRLPKAGRVVPGTRRRA